MNEIIIAASPPAITAGMNGQFSIVESAADTYAPIAIKPACPNENNPVKPVKSDSPKTTIILIPQRISIPSK